MADDFEDLTQSSDTATEELDSATSGYLNASLLIKQLDTSSMGELDFFKTANLRNKYFLIYSCKSSCDIVWFLKTHNSTSCGKAGTVLVPLFIPLFLDSVNMVKLQNMFHEYEHTIQKERNRHSRLADKVSQLEQEQKDLKLLLNESRESKSNLEHLRLELETELNNFK